MSHVHVHSLVPRLFHLQYLIAYSMQIQRGSPGRFGHMWLHQVVRG